MTFAVALVTNWAKLKGGLRSKAVSALNLERADAGICALYAKALQSGDPGDYETLFCTAREAGYGVSGVLVRQYLGKLKLSGKSARVTPWLGIYEAIEFMSK